MNINIFSSFPIPQLHSMCRVNILLHLHTPCWLCRELWKMFSFFASFYLSLVDDNCDSTEDILTPGCPARLLLVLRLPCFVGFVYCVLQSLLSNWRVGSQFMILWVSFFLRMVVVFIFRGIYFLKFTGCPWSHQEREIWKWMMQCYPANACDFEVLRALSCLRVPVCLLYCPREYYRL